MATHQDQTTLTQFATPPSESKSSQSFFSRLLRRDKRISHDKPAAIAYTPARRNKVSFNLPVGNNDQESAYAASDTESPTAGSRRRLAKTELRTFPNVLGRLSSILDKKSSTNEGFRPYKDSEFRMSWMPDSSCKECYDCGNKFTTFTRRHHCRICGQIFCSSCCNQEVPGRVMGFEGGLRACTYCCGVVTGLMEGSDSGDLTGTLRDNLKAQLSNSSTSSVDLRASGSHGSYTPRRLSVSDSFESPSNRIASVFDIAPTSEPMQDMTSEERQSLVKDSLQLKALFFEMLDPVNGVQLSSKRHRLRTYPDCFHGIELKDWLVEHDKAQDKPQAVIIGQALLDARYVRCLTDPNRSTFFSDYTLYQFRHLSHAEAQSGQVRRLSLYPECAEDQPVWVRELEQNDLNAEASADFGQSLARSVISNMTAGDDRERSKSHLLEATCDSDSKTNFTPTLISGSVGRFSNEQITAKEDIHAMMAMPLHVPDRELSTSMLHTVDKRQDAIHDQFKALYDEHLLKLCTQLLERSKVSLTWADIIMQLASNISHYVRADVGTNQDQMNIGSYVHIKKVRSGEPSSSGVTYGVVCTKSVIHNKMKTSIRSPQIMLLQSSIEYQRVTNKLSSLDPQILQEKEYLQNCVAKICKCKPNVLLVEGTVSRVAQQLLLNTGITVVINVKTSVMRRLARMTMADVIPSIDSLISPPQLGTCYMFQTDLYRFDDGFYKTLMAFSGCPANLGCTVMLRGTNYAELVKVKPILLMIVQACYHGKLELSFLSDMSALPSTEKNKKGRSRHPSAESKDSLDLIMSVKPSDSTRANDSVSSSPSISSLHRLVSNDSSSAFQRILNKLILDFSPFVRVPSPYFETERGRISCNKLGIIPPVFISPLLSQAGDTDPASVTRTRGSNELFDHRMQKNCVESLTAELRDAHEFIAPGINCSVDRKHSKELQASYMARGGRLVVKPGVFNNEGAYNELYKEKVSKPEPDCFDISFHQRIFVLFSSYTLDSSLHSCVKPWIVPMQFYGKNDLTLGQFLEVYCFLSTYVCPRQECEVPMIEHVRKFVHGTGSLYLVLRRIVIQEEELQSDKQITTWSWCRRCKKATPVVPLAPASWHLSFARYLQLRLNCILTGSQVSEDCVHSISRDYYQYFRLKDVVASFRYSSATVREVLFPAAQVSTKFTITKKDVTSQIGIIHTHGLGLFSEVLETLYKLEGRQLDSEGKKKLIADSKKDLEEGKDWFTSEIYRIQTKLLEEQLPMGDDLHDFRLSSTTEYSMLYQLEDDIVKLKCYLSRAVQQWNIRLDLVATKDDRAADRKVKGESNMLNKSVKLPEIPNNSPAEAVEAPPMSSRDPDGPVTSAADEQLNGSGSLHERSSSCESVNDTLPLVGSDEQVLAHHHNSISHGLRAGVQRASTIVSNAGSIDSSFVVCGTPDTKAAAKRTVTQAENLSTDGKSAVVFHVDAITTDSPRSSEGAAAPNSFGSRMDRTLVSSMSEAFLVSSVSPTDTDMLRSSSTLPDIVQSTNRYGSVDAMLSQEHDLSSAGSPAAARNSDLLDHPDTNSNHFTDMSESEDTVEDLTSSFGKDKKGQGKTLRRNANANDALLSISTSRKSKKPKPAKKSRYFIDSVKSMVSAAEEVISPIENPFSDNEHYLLQPTTNIPVIIYDEEPSSIVAYALGSQAYENKMLDFQKQEAASRAAESQDPSKPLPEKAELNTDNIEAVLKLTSIKSVTASIKSYNSSSSPASLTTVYDSHDIVDWSDIPNNALQQARSESHFGDVDPYRFGKPKDTHEPAFTSNQHFEMQFTEKSVGDDKMSLFYCKVYFAAEFKKLRQLMYADGEDHFIRSLSRCYKWNAKGGKSGLGFCKTKDERFIIKQMGRQEIHSFMDFGPQYFDYLTNSVQSSDASKGKCTLAKIFGVYRIGLKNFVTNAVFKQDVLVMENLFYGHRVSKVFDLKGSDRNRLAKKETVMDSVLLDENFMRYSKQSPIYVREHSKKLLMEALVSDSQFLSKHTVMDYSLLCGYDDDTKELVIGIIDYIRTFTWDKKLETVVKSSGILGGQGKMPTIVSPEVYRTRFLEAMERYLNVVPDRWGDFAVHNH